MSKEYRTTSHVVGGANEGYDDKCRELESQNFHCKSGRLVVIEEVRVYVSLYIRDQPTLREAVKAFLDDSNYSFNHVSNRKYSIEEAYARETPNGEEG